MTMEAVSSEILEDFNEERSFIGSMGFVYSTIAFCLIFIQILMWPVATCTVYQGCLYLN